MANGDLSQELSGEESLDRFMTFWTRVQRLKRSYLRDVQQELSELRRTFIAEIVSNGLSLRGTRSVRRFLRDAISVPFQGFIDGELSRVVREILESGLETAMMFSDLYEDDVGGFDEPAESRVNRFRREVVSIADLLEPITTSFFLNMLQVVKRGNTSGIDARAFASEVRDNVDGFISNVLVKVDFFAEDVYNQGRWQVMQRNNDTVKYYQHLSVIDNRTGGICASRDGLLWNAEDLSAVNHDKEFDIPPLHDHCRSAILPIFEGQDPVEETAYSDFLRRQTKQQRVELIGRERTELFDRGEFNVRNLTNDGLGYLTLPELRTLNE